MTKKEVNDDRRGEERRQNAISNRTAFILIPYSDVRSINIQLHQDSIALSILLLFSRSLPTYISIRRICAYLKDWQRWKRKEGGGNVYVRRQSTVYKIDRGIIMFVPECSVSNHLQWTQDLWSWDERMLTYLRCHDIFRPSLLPLLSIDYYRNIRFGRNSFQKKKFYWSI